MLHGDTFHPDFILAAPPFNISDWGGARLGSDKRWQYGASPKANANFACVQHIVHHLAPASGAGLVLANGSMSSNQACEGSGTRSKADCLARRTGHEALS